jgi:hypothetical protein
MKLRRYLIMLIGLVCLASCTEPNDKRALILKDGTVIDGHQYQGGPVTSSSSWEQTPQLKAKLAKDGKQVGTRYTHPVTGSQYVSLGSGWRMASDDDEQVSASQRGSILLIIGSTVKAARDMETLEMLGGNPLTRHGFSDRTEYAALMKDYQSGMRAIHKGGGVDAASSSEMIRSSLPTSFDNEKARQSKSEKRRRLLNAAASSIGRSNPFVVQSFMAKIETEAKTQSETSPPRAETKAPTP